MKRLVCLTGAIVGAVTFSQVPEYSQQYAQRLGGAIDELATIAVRFDADAAASGLTRQEGLERYEQSTDAFLADRGQSMRLVFERHQRLSAQLEALRNAGPLERIGSLTRYFDTDVGAAALENYAPAVPVTTEGFGHAVVGLIAGYGLIWGIWSAGALPFRRNRRARRAARSM